MTNFTPVTELMAQVIEQAGLRLEDNFRVSDEGIAMTPAAAEAIAATGFPMTIEGTKPEVFEQMGINRKGGFVHPLAGQTNGWLNGWSTASMLVNAANGWVEPKPAPPIAIRETKALVALVDPTISAEALLRAARYNDAKLMQLLSLINQGVEKGRAASSE